MRVPNLLFWMVLSFAGFSMAESTKVSGDILDDLIAKSPVFQKLDYSLKHAKAAAVADLAWKNPEFEIEQEKLSNTISDETELIFSINKEFTFPWAGTANRKAIRKDVEALEQKITAQKRSFKAAIYTLYIELAQLDQHIEMLINIDEHLDQIAHSADDQMEQGRVSGLEARLLQHALDQVRVARLDYLQRRRSLESRFKLELGLENLPLEINGRVDYQFVDLSDMSDYQQAVREHPWLESLKAERQSLESQVRLAKAGRLPSFHLSGGYKRVNDDLDGYVIGLGLPLPLLNTHSGKVQKMQARVNMAQIDELQAEKQLIQNISVLIEDIKELQLFFESALEPDENLFKDLLLSYEQGWSSLADLLGGTELFLSSLSTYQQQLLKYYENILSLGAKTGNNFISLPLEKK